MSRPIAKLARMLLNILLLLAALYSGLAGLLFFMQSQMVYYPNVGRDVTTTPRAIGLAYEDVWLDSGADKVHGWYVGHERARGAALILHGNAGSIGLRLDWLRMFHELGYATLIVDYRGYGRSGGSPSEANTYADARLAWEHLTRERGWRAGDIVVLGESLGGPIAAHLVAHLEQAPRALVLHSTFVSLPEIAAHHYRFMPVRWLARFRYDTREYLASVKAPVLVAHSPGDELVPYAHGRALYEAASGRKAFLELAGGHNDAFIFARKAWIEALARFLDGEP